jgi:ArsR family transcriptional regulator
MEIKQAVVALTALAQESRLRVFRLLVPAGEVGLAAGEIAERLELPPATLTFHLKELSHAGLVESRREGRSIIYSLRCDGMRELLDFLAQDCCQGQPELCSIALPQKRASRAGAGSGSRRR